jgi:aryl-alcohol dehydrogenase-like predicted oxidoreductase
MTFGTEWGWGSPEKTAQTILMRYLECGGNFLDTADGYTNGTSETLLGKFLSEAGSGLRDKLVLATKYSFGGKVGDPNSGGNGRKSMMNALEGSLKRLQTDYVDLYWMHVWDRITPVEEVMATFDTMVRQGKVRYIGLSDTPAWYLARAQTMAEFRGWEKICALQLEYSFIERNIEREHVPAALELGMGICTWSPLGGGLLSGKYQQKANEVSGDGRLQQTLKSANPTWHKFNERNFKLTDQLVSVAKELGRTPAQVALNWVTKRPAVTSTIIGATSPQQLDDNLHSLDFEIPAALSKKLEEASRPEVIFPYRFFEPQIQSMTTGGETIHKEPRWFRSQI